jgi:hypothetical protein
LELQWSPLTVWPLIFEAPFEQHVFRNVALAIVAGLITERTLNNQTTGGSDQWVQLVFLSEGDLADDPKMSPIDGNHLAYRFRQPHLRRGVFEGVSLHDGPTIVQFPVDWNVTLNARSVNMHAGLKIQFKG